MTCLSLHMIELGFGLCFSKSYVSRVFFALILVCLSKTVGRKASILLLLLFFVNPHLSIFFLLILTESGGGGGWGERKKRREKH